jgi:O-antigen ligase
MHKRVWEGRKAPVSIEAFERMGERLGVGRLRGVLRRAWAPANQATSAVFSGALLLLVVSVLFGGAAQTNALSLMAVELASLPLLFIALYLVLARAAPAGALIPLVLLGLIVAVPILQLIPLPAAVWTAAPGRTSLVHALDAMREGRPSLPFSLAPQQTWRCALALAPPAAMFMGGLFLTDGQRRFMAGGWLALAVASLGVGVLQMLGGADSALYFYPITNADSPVGFFSNRNHQASFLLCLLPVAAAFAARFEGRFDGPRALPTLLAMLYVFIAIVGVAATRSRAGIFLGGVALLASVALVLRGGALRRHWRASLGVALGALVAIGAVLVFGLNPILDRFGSGGEPRFEGWPVVLAAARSFLPLGSGVGSFEAVYQSVEPLSQVSPIYFNHAHNDFLELWLETGLVGAALLAGFLAWFALRCAAIWRGRSQSSRADLAAACTLLIGLLLAHSIVDYPLRTEALMVLFAFACSTIAVYRPSQRAAGGRARQRG